MPTELIPPLPLVSSEPMVSQLSTASSGNIAINAGLIPSPKLPPNDDWKNDEEDEIVNGAF